MAEPLKNQFSTDIPGKIAGMIAQVFPEFDSDSFVRDALSGYEALNLMARGWKIARTLRSYLPDDYESAIKILIESLGPKLVKTENNGMATFLYLPHVIFISEYGLDFFEISMHAQYELTQRFTAEFSIRPFIEKYPEATLARLKVWANDKNPHVRRLVSEGTRPRLPWASRLPEFQKDPAPVLELLELLKNDPELYVRRSVANSLNDIGKDNPLILVETARRWLKEASSQQRRWLVRHALRSAVKRADLDAMALLGYDNGINISTENASITPAIAEIGGSVTISFDITNKDSLTHKVMVDCRVHFVKATGKTSPKVFKLKSVSLEPQETIRIKKSISLREMTTRKHYPGTHNVEIMINGLIKPLGLFELILPIY